MQWLILTLFLAILACRLWLRHLNLRHLEQYGHEIPPAF